MYCVTTYIIRPTNQLFQLSDPIKIDGNNLSDRIISYPFFIPFRIHKGYVSHPYETRDDIERLKPRLL